MVSAMYMRCIHAGVRKLAQKPITGVKFNRNIEAGDCEVRAISKSRKSAHPPSDRPRSITRLALVHVDLWVKHPAESYGGCQSLAMFTDGVSRMRWVVIIKTKDEAADVLSQVIRDVSYPERICIGKIRCDGGGEFRGRFEALVELLGFPIETNAPYILSLIHI